MNVKKNKSTKDDSLEDLAVVLEKSSSEERLKDDITSSSSWVNPSEDFDFWGGINLCTTFY